MSLRTGGAGRTKTTGFMSGNEGNELFGPQTPTEVSNVVQIDDEPIVVRAHGLRPGDRVLVEMVDGEGAGEYFSPYMRRGSQLRLTRKCNHVAIAVPGRYRFVLEGQLGLAYVRYFRASMTHEFLLESQQMGCCDEFPTTLPPSGKAGGDLEGDYPNPTVNPVAFAARLAGDASAQQLLAQALCDDLGACIDERMDGKIPAVPTTLPPSGTAGGDLEGDYPAPKVDPQKVVERIRLNIAALEALAAYLCPVMRPCIEDAAKVSAADMAAVFARCDGSPHAPGNALPTCEEVDTKISQAIGSIPADKYLEIVGYDPVSHTMTFTVANDGETFTVNLSDLVPIVTGQGMTGDGTVGTPAEVKLRPNGGLAVDTLGLSVSFAGATAPATQTATDLPTALYGDRTALLGQPAGWVDIGGSKKVPYWN